MIFFIKKDNKMKKIDVTPEISKKFILTTSSNPISVQIQEKIYSYKYLVAQRSETKKNYFNPNFLIQNYIYQTLQ